MLLDWFFRWFSRTALWLWFSKNIVGKLNLRIWGYTKFPMEKYFEIVDKILDSEREAPGIYCFVSCDPSAFSGWLIRNVTRSVTSHAGVFHSVVDYHECRINHMTSKGFLNDHFLSLLREVDYLGVVKYEFWDEETRDRAYERLAKLRMIAPTYDFQQELSSKNKVYCSELIFLMLDKIPYLNSIREEVYVHSHEEFSRQVFEPDDVWQQATEIIWKNF